MNLEQIQYKREELLDEIRAIEVNSQNPNDVMLRINKCALQRELLADMATTAYVIKEAKENIN